MKWKTWILLTALALLAVGCGADGAVDEGSEEEVVEQATDTDGDLPDRCSLITAEEASALAGYELEVGQDSFLGCGFLPPGAQVADLTVNAVLLDGDAATVAATTPSGDAVASIITMSGNRVVELAMVFLGIDPDDTARIEEAAELAVTALGRWDG